MQNRLYRVIFPILYGPFLSDHSQATMWQCPSCGRRFNQRNQFHSCEVYDLDRHLGGKPGSVTATFHLLAGKVSEFGEVEIVPLKSTILFRVETAFASVSVRQRWVDVLFALPRAEESPRIKKIEQASATTIVHRVRLESPGEVDDDLLAWLREARELAAR